MICSRSGAGALFERLTPEQVVGFLNTLLSRIGGAVTREGGVIDKFIGDAVMAFWNAPLRQNDHARRACAAALGMRAAMRELNAMWDDLNLKEIRHEDSITTQLRDLRGKNEALQALTGQAQNCNTWAEAVDSSILGQNTPTGFDTTLGEVEASLAKLT